jgi:hypothetical protein
MRTLLEPNIQAKLDRLTKLEWALERAITLPIIGKKAGLDAVLGLIPGAGDLIAGALGSYIIVEAVHARAPKWLIARMMWNLGFDTTLGAVPIVGDIFDLFFASNTKNIKLLKAHLEKQAAKTPQPPTDVTRITSLSGAPGRAQTA